MAYLGYVRMTRMLSADEFPRIRELPVTLSPVGRSKTAGSRMSIFLDTEKADATLTHPQQGIMG